MNNDPANANVDLSKMIVEKDKPIEYTKRNITEAKIIATCCGIANAFGYFQLSNNERKELFDNPLYHSSNYWLGEAQGKRELLSFLFKVYVTPIYKNEFDSIIAIEVSCDGFQQRYEVPSFEILKGES